MFQGYNYKLTPHTFKVTHTCDQTAGSLMQLSVAKIKMSSGLCSNLGSLGENVSPGLFPLVEATFIPWLVTLPPSSMAAWPVGP